VRQAAAVTHMQTDDHKLRSAGCKSCDVKKLMEIRKTRPCRVRNDFVLMLTFAIFRQVLHDFAPVVCNTNEIYIRGNLSTQLTHISMFAA
jgi:hypothetical protein